MKSWKATFGLFLFLSIPAVMLLPTVVMAEQTKPAQQNVAVPTSAADGTEPAEASAAKPPSDADKTEFKLTGVLEAGFLSVLSHTVQFSEDGTRFDYVREGGQDTLFAVWRASAELQIDDNHSFVFVYQPLSLVTRVNLRRDVRIDGLDYPAGTPVKLIYNFPFYRLSYLYDTMDDADTELSFGLGLQIRNATIAFQSLDGTLLRTNQDVGPVPLLKFRGRLPLSRHVWVGAEMDGLYAPISYLNGSDTEVTGAILDASLRAGARFKDVDAFLNVRFLGGGAVGTSDDETGPGDGYVRNWLGFLTVSLGVTVSVY